MSSEGQGTGGKVVQLFPRGTEGILKKSRGPLSRTRRRIGLPGVCSRGIKNVADEEDVIPFVKRMKGCDVVAEEYPKKVGADLCFSLMEEIAPVTDDIKNLLQVPDSLYRMSGGISFASNPDSTIAGVVYALSSHTGLPEKMPEYGIHISEHGSSVFCTLVDRKRKIVVHEAVNSMYGKQGSWKRFAAAVKEALDAVKEEPTSLKFVVNTEGLLSVI